VSILDAVDGYIRNMRIEKPHNDVDKQTNVMLISHKQVYILLPMPTAPANDPKLQALRTSHTLHPHPDKVRHPLFVAGGFFDARDLLQVKYEALRAIQAEGQTLSQVARDFGLSRPTVYEAKSLLAVQGLDGLVPGKVGPKTAHKFTAEVLDFLKATRTQEPTISALELARRIQQRFRITVHPRSIERALVRHQEKKGRPNSPPKNP
jgi:transposase